MIHKDGCPFAHGQYGIFLYLRIWGEDALGEALHHRAGEGEILGEKSFRRSFYTIPLVKISIKKVRNGYVTMAEAIQPTNQHKVHFFANKQFIQIIQ